MAYDYSKLNGKIREVFGTQGKLAKVIPLSERALSVKLNNKQPFKQDEISLIAKLLHIPDEEISLYFFTPKVQSV